MESTNGDSITDITAFVVPNICSALGRQEIDRAKKYFARLNDVDLADSHRGGILTDIDLLEQITYVSFSQKTRNRGRVVGNQLHPRPF